MEVVEDLIELKLGKKRDEEINTDNLVYFDYAGCPLSSKSLLSNVYKELLEFPLGNPHSVGGIISTRTEKIVNETRTMVLNHIGADPAEYEVIFTGGATSSVKLICDMLPWQEEFQLTYPQNVHTSLLTMRNFAKEWNCIPVADLYGVSEQFIPCQLPPVRETILQNQLLLVPGECNMSGAKFSPEKLYTIIEKLKSSSKFYWLLDAAKYCATSELNLSEFPEEYRPDFIILSFYKLFGYPTGIGALIMKKNIMSQMKKKYFGGGTLQSGAADRDFMVTQPKTNPKHYEDGTINFHGIAAIRHGFRFLSSLGGMKEIQEFTFQLMNYLFQEMKNLFHDPINRSSKPVPLCVIYSPSDDKITPSRQGPVITFNLQYADGEPIGFNEVNRLASENQIQIRTGCFCNLGGCQFFLKITGEESEEFYHLGRVCSDGNEIDVVNSRQTGACRISLGYGSTKNDCNRFIEFLKSNFLNKLPANPLLSLHQQQQQYQQQSLLPHNNSRIEDNEQDMNDEKYFWHHETQDYPIPPRNPKSSLSFPSPRSAASTVILSAIFIYPIKSCSGIRVNSWPISRDGLKFDRYFAIIENQSGKVITQKQFPSLALIQPSFHMEKLQFNGLCQETLTMHVTSSLMESILIIPLEIIQSEPQQQKSITKVGESMEFGEFNICGRKVFGNKISKDANEWFTTFLNLSHEDEVKTISNQTEDIPMEKKKLKSFSLIQHSSSSNENSKGDKMKGKSTEILEELGNSKKSKLSSLDTQSFANTSQYLLLSMESIKALIQLIYESKRTSKDADDQHDPGQELEEDLFIKVENFRPNLIVSSSSSLSTTPALPHQEDHWKSLTLPVTSYYENEERTHQDQEIVLAVTGPCSRCSMVNVNGKSGVMSCRVFEALKEYRKVNSHVYFGQFLSFQSFLLSSNNREDNNSNSEGEDIRLSVGVPIKID